MDGTVVALVTPDKVSRPHSNSEVLLEVVSDQSNVDQSNSDRAPARVRARTLPTGATDVTSVVVHSTSSPRNENGKTSDAIERAATIDSPPGSSDLLAVCGTCEATIDLTLTRQRVIDGRITIACVDCLDERPSPLAFDLSDGDDACVDTDALVDVSDGHDIEAPTHDTAGGAIEFVDQTDEREDSTAPSTPIVAVDVSTLPPPALRLKHVAMGGGIAMVVAAIAMFAPGSATSPAAKAPASINTPMPTEELSPSEQAAPEKTLASVTADLSASDAARAHRDAIRERKRIKALARLDRSKRTPMKARVFGKYSLGPLPVAVQGENWIHPLPGMEKKIASSFGQFGARRDHRHRPDCGRGHCGYDLLGPWNMPVVSVLDGVVERVVWRNRRPSGRFVLIRHAAGLRTWYMHLHRPRHGLRPGMKVRAGEEIGRLGTTGLRDKVPHLHFSLDKDGRFYADPQPFLHSSTVIAKPRKPAVDPKSRM